MVYTRVNKSTDGSISVGFISVGNPRHIHANEKGGRERKRERERERRRERERNRQRKRQREGGRG
jgi:hypothetical protein